MNEASLGGEFLLQVGYERHLHEHFMTSRSRVVEFRRVEDALLMFEVRRRPSETDRLLATIPIRGRSGSALLLDFNSGFDKIYLEEDRTGEDYYGRADRRDYSYFRLFRRDIRSVRTHGRTLVLEQHALDRGDDPVVVHYYLRPYRPSPDFESVELRNLERFGFYQTYPQEQRNGTVLYATKFGVREPIVFALSPQIPARHRQAVRDGILYWNRAFGVPLLRAIDAPAGVKAPDAQYNVVDWKTGGGPSTSHIQTDPRTGQILHAHIFVVPDAAHRHAVDLQNDHLRYIAAHEVGHALGLRHNFAPGPVSTIMNYFSFDEAARIGREIVAAQQPALDYDRLVVRDVYLDEPVPRDALPPFCTDHQPDCAPFERRRRAVGAVAPPN